MDCFLVRDFTDTKCLDHGGGFTNGPPPMQFICGIDDLVKVIDLAREVGRKIVVLKVGACILDWS